LSFIRERIKWALFPGFNLHARQRFNELPALLATGRNGQERLVLDAGCGNGMLSYASYRLGDRVIAISIKEGEIARNMRMFNEFMGISPDRIDFRLHNLYDVQKLGLQFDSIICTEVMEHITDDAGLCRRFWQILKPGGMLHITTPNADHPDNQNEKIDADEGGGHVRAGYTFATLRSVLLPIGFRIEQEMGLGGPVRQACNKRIIALEERFGIVAAAGLFAATWPLPWLDGKPRVPYCIYVRAVKG
jgi:2-polyprenyl-3-methyl-5-hydroxy-6-metoxy-1,4-benzoquinol methylase